MAASKDFQEKISQLLECSICLDRLNDPKVLQCTHSYCKTCLDSILQFRDDGSAFIECPLRCFDYTEVGIKETTKDLKTPIQFKNLVDMLSEEVEGCDISQVRKTCICGGDVEYHNSVLYFCPNCNVILCSTCQPKHNHCRHGNGVIEHIPIKYSKTNDDIIPWCTKHAAFANYVCQGEFVCVYCKEREPEKCRSQNVQSVHSQIKAWVNNEIAGSGKFKDVIQNAIGVTEAEITNIRNSLTTTLRKRKIKCLSEYLGKLNQDEERLIKEFDFVTSNHVKEHLSTTAGDYVDVNPPFQIIYNKENIYRNVSQLKTGKITLPSVKVSLTGVNYASVDPLRTVVGETNQEGYLLHFSSKQITSCVSNDIPNEDIGDTTTSLIKQLERLLQQALKVTPKVKKVDEKSGDGSPEVDKEELTKAFIEVSKSGMCGINNLCADKKEELIIKMLKMRKEIFYIKGWTKQGLSKTATILHMASWYGCIKLMKFILNNSDIKVDVKDGFRRTPLNYATRNKQTKAGELLLEYHCKLF